MKDFKKNIKQKYIHFQKAYLFIYYNLQSNIQCLVNFKNR